MGEEGGQRRHSLVGCLLQTNNQPDQICLEKSCLLSRRQRDVTAVAT